MAVGKCSFRSFLPIIMKNTRSVKSCFPYLSNSTIEKFGEVLELLTSFFGASEHWLYCSRKTNVLLEVEKRLSSRRWLIAEKANRRKTSKWDFFLWIFVIKRIQSLNIIQNLRRLAGSLTESLYQWYAVWENNKYWQEFVLVFQWQFCRKNTQNCNWSM